MKKNYRLSRYACYWPAVLLSYPPARTTSRSMSNKYKMLPTTVNS